MMDGKSKGPGSRVQGSGGSYSVGLAALPTFDLESAIEAMREIKQTAPTEKEVTEKALLVLSDDPRWSEVVGQVVDGESTLVVSPRFITGPLLDTLRERGIDIVENDVVTAGLFYCVRKPRQAFGPRPDFEARQGFTFSGTLASLHWSTKKGGE